MHDVDVLVVGGGPSGLTVAGEVARSGASVLVLEKRTADPIPRAGTVLPRPLELFDSRGIADRFISKISEFNPHPFQPSHVWAGMHPVNWSGLDTRFGFTLFLSQHDSELILRAWAAEAGAEIRFQHELVELEDRGTDVRAVVRHGEEQYEVVARYVVGADGGRSTTRSLVGINLEGRDASFTGVIATAEMDFPWAGSLRVGHNSRGWCSSFPFGQGLTRFTIIHADERSRAQEEPVTAEEVARCASEILETEVVIDKLAAGSRYGDTHKVVDRFSAGRVFLVGEAVRLHYPASGVGMNFCIQDAFNLGWKLASVLKGDAGESLLSTYETERRVIVDDLLASVDAQVGVQFNFTPRGQAFQQMFERDMLPLPEVTAHVCRQLNGLSSGYPASEGDHGSVGWRLPDFELLRRDGSSVRIYELLRTSPFVVVDLTGYQTLGADEVEGLPAVIVAGFPTNLPASVKDAKAIIVRPDSYVGWASDDIPAEGTVRAALKSILHA